MRRHTFLLTTVNDLVYGRPIQRRGLRFTIVVRRMLLAVTIINQEHADDASASLPILHIFRYT